jgi:hypothetical protein
MRLDRSLTIATVLTLTLLSTASRAETPPATMEATEPVAVALPTTSAAVAATPSATPSPAPAPTPTPKPSATPIATPAPKKAAATDDLTKNCALYFPGRIQGELRNACASAGLKFTAAEKGLQQTKCRLTYGEEPRAVMACLIGVSIADDIIGSRVDFKRKLQLCADQYPQHTEIDAFLQESCLTGIHLPELLPALSAAPYDSCGQLSPERSFIGPCSVGLSLVNQTASTGGPNEQNLMCEKYFDHRKFHLTYRACLNARSVTVEDAKKVDDVIRDCSNIVSDPGNDEERAACLIGSNIHRALEKKQDVTKRFGKCGTNKVTYEDRNILACLTAASLVDMVGKGPAENGCKSVFKAPKGSSRGDCLSALSQQL